MKSAIIPIFSLFSLMACRGGENNSSNQSAGSPSTVPGFFKPGFNETPTLTTVSKVTDHLEQPCDLDFNPNDATELWVLNQGKSEAKLGKVSKHGTTVIYTNAGTTLQKSTFITEPSKGVQFIGNPSAISFSREKPVWAISQDNNTGAPAGITLWSSELTIYGHEVNAEKSSYLGIFHNCPYSEGIETDGDYAFWTYNGNEGNIIRYNFFKPHQPGASDRSEGEINKYPEITMAKLSKPGNIPAHLVKDRATGWLYIVDGENKRILRMNTKTGTQTPNNDGKMADGFADPNSQYIQTTGVTWEVFANQNLRRPCGIELVGDILYVTDYESGDIIAYNKNSKKELARVKTGKPGIMGIKADSSGILWFVNATTNEVIRIDPK